MKRWRMLLLLEFKRYGKALPGIVTAILILVFVVGAMAVSGQYLMQTMTVEDVQDLSQESGESKISAAIAIQDKSRAVNFVKSMIKNINSVDALLNIQYVEEEEGLRLLEEQKISVLMIVREKTISGIMNGENVPIEVVFPDHSGYEAAIFKEFADAAVRMLSVTQAAIYSIYDLYDEYDVYEYKDGAIERMNVDYIKSVLGREFIYQEETVSTTGEVPMSLYYLCGSLVLFSLFLPIMLLFVGKSKKDNLSAMLFRSGTGHIKQVVAELIPIVSVYLLIGVLFGGVCTVGKLTGAVWMKDISLLQIWSLVVTIIPVGLLNGAYALFVCRWIRSIFGQVMFLFLTGLFQGVVTGCLIPTLLLPKALAAWGKFTLADGMKKSFLSVFSGETAVDEFCIMLLESVIFILAAAWMERKTYGNRMPERRRAK